MSQLIRDVNADSVAVVARLGGCPLLKTHKPQKVKLFAVCTRLNGKCDSVMLFFATVEMQQTQQTHVQIICFSHIGYIPGAFNLK